MYDVAAERLKRDERCCVSFKCTLSSAALNYSVVLPRGYTSTRKKRSLNDRMIKICSNKIVSRDQHVRTN